MGILAGPFVGAALLLVLGGMFKARRPEPTAKALRDVGLGRLAPLARLLGVAEIAAGAAALAFTGPLAAAVVADFYAAFAGFVLLRLIRPETQPAQGGCGCFGNSEGPPTVVHVVLNGAAAAVAGAVAAGSGGGLSTALHGQPWGGVPLLLLAAVTTGLAYAALTVLPRTFSELKTT